MSMVDPDQSQDYDHRFAHSERHLITATRTLLNEVNDWLAYSAIPKDRELKYKIMLNTYRDPRSDSQPLHVTKAAGRLHFFGCPPETRNQRLDSVVSITISLADLHRPQPQFDSWLSEFEATMGAM